MDQIDPFKSDLILSLNLKTFRDSKDAVNSKDIESIHQFMSKMDNLVLIIVICDV